MLRGTIALWTPLGSCQKLRLRLLAEGTILLVNLFLPCKSTCIKDYPKVASLYTPADPLATAYSASMGSQKLFSYVAQKYLPHESTLTVYNALLVRHFKLAGVLTAEAVAVLGVHIEMAQACSSPVDYFSVLPAPPSSRPFYSCPGTSEDLVPSI